MRSPSNRLLTDEEIEVAERVELLEDCKEESASDKQTDNDRHSNTIYTKSIGRQESPSFMETTTPLVIPEKNQHVHPSFVDATSIC